MLNEAQMEGPQRQFSWNTAQQEEAERWMPFDSWQKMLEAPVEPAGLSFRTVKEGEMS